MPKKPNPSKTYSQIELLEMSLAGTEPISDDTFFEVLEGNSLVLGTTVFQDRIKEWQEICQWPDMHSQEEAAAARSNLHKIGRVLAGSGPGPGSPQRLPHYLIQEEYYKTIRFIKDFFAKSGKKPSANILIRKYPQWKEAFLTESGRRNHRSEKEMALRLTQFRLARRKNPLAVSIKTLRRIIK